MKTTSNNTQGDEDIQKTDAFPWRSGLVGALALGSAAFVAGTLAKVFLNTDEYDGLHSLVSYSSRMIAAARAMEDEEDEESRLVYDPLATHVAGRKALNKARRRRVKAPPGYGRRWKISRIGIRTKWFDDQLEECLGMPDSYRSTPTASERTHVIDTFSCQNTSKKVFPVQVVEIGAGLSTRPWRLHLPATLAWFDVDRQDVIDVKEDVLHASGAEIDVMSPVRRSQSKNSILEQKIGSLDHHSLGVEYPIRCESRSSVPADLNNPSWKAALTRAGFDTSKATVWILEGILMYLTRDRVDALLQELASMSAPGSCLITGHVTEEVVRDISKHTNSRLMKEWLSGCPREPTDWMKGLGWDVQGIHTRATIASALGIPKEVCAFESDPDNPSSMKSLFIAATIAS
eukprot:CAMPEP_0118800410 /NCGR_PEP_ID=MMETSP1161-20130426/2320_1 /TAXON_ID=249345 /ORGANISM="Picochlorum oklahomensis, Strain CCMP2329" /LENGTH=402 /DNA_ID=CAMNT_0006728235 /DNA_START=26 /DNA_END=1234 /DNA_ORIENTATION=-